MKKYITIIVTILLLGGIVFLIAGKKDVQAPNAQDLDGPMRKINVEDADPLVVSECNRQLRTTTFETEIESDRFFLECMRKGEGQDSVDVDADLEIVQNPITFTGELERVDTGCFADGECFVVVDGKHITALLGRSRDIVGQVVGIETGFGGLEGLVGKEIEVYAHKIDAKNYTLYGSADYYIKVL